MNNDKFNRCMKFVFDREGRVYENDPHDPGGETKYGISKKSYPNISIKELTEEQAKAIYLRDFWNKLNCDQYENRLALAVFDTGVNQGPKMAMDILEELKKDGVPLTAEAFLFKRLRHYTNLIQTKPALERYCHNWMLRVIKVYEYKFI